MPGAVAFGFHEGSRSEYLAQYVFGSWGTAVAIPHQEDHGIDLTCTLMERVGKRYLARSPYTVQVKSNLDPVVFEGSEAVRWLIEHPLPLFLCVVDKASARLSVYHTLPRFYAWARGEWPGRLEMIPSAFTQGQAGRGPQWSESYSFSLDQPILDFNVTQMQDETFWDNAKKVFEFWVGVENDNLTRVHAKVPACRLPGGYTTNEAGGGAWEQFWFSARETGQFDQTASGLKDSVEWIANELFRRGDLEGTAKAALLHRHLFPRAIGGPLDLLQGHLNRRLGLEGHYYAGVDNLAAMMKAALEGQASPE